MAVSRNWGVVSFDKSPVTLGSVLGPLIFGNSHISICSSSSDGTFPNLGDEGGPWQQASGVSSKFAARNLSLARQEATLIGAGLVLP